MKLACENSTCFYVYNPGFERMECTNEFQVRFGRKDGQSVAHCRGRLVYGSSAEPLRYAILWNQHLVVDFRRVPSIDAAGLGMLAQLQVLATVMGVILEFCNVNAHIRQLLRVSNLDSVLRVIGDEQDDSIRAVGA